MRDVTNPWLGEHWLIWARTRGEREFWEWCANERSSTTLLLRSRWEKGRRVDPRIHVNCPWFNRHPERTTRKKVMLHNVLPFFRSQFLTRKNSFVQKVSKSFKKFRLFKFRRVPISVYTEIPLLLGSSLDVSEKVVTARHSLISFWQNEFQPTLICWFAVGTSYTGDPDWHIWWLRVGETSSVDNLCFALGVHLFCEFLRPLVSEFDGGSEFLIRNCVWASIFIHLIVPHISRYQLL